MTIGNALTFCLLAWFGALAMLVAGRMLNGDIDCSGMLVSKRGSNDINPERIVTIALVPAMLAYYAIEALHTGAVTIAGRTSMPDLPESFVSLLTGSNGLYLAGKLARSDKSPRADKSPPSERKRT